MVRRVNGRAKKTLNWIVLAFYELLRKRKYGEIHVNDIVSRAGVGRSTFYDHFKSKEQLLERSLAEVLTVLADALDCGDETERLESTMCHLWDVRDSVNKLMHACTEPLVSKMLTDIIETRLDGICQARGATLTIPQRLAAGQIAGAQLGLIRGWLEGSHQCPSGEIARALRLTSSNIVEALLSTHR